MAAKLYQVDLPPQILSRGFWLYAWEVIGATGERFSYIGMTGDVTGVAQSPYARAGAHLGWNANNNALRRHLCKRGVAPETCKSIKFFAYGPLLAYTHGQPRDQQYETNRTLVGALERQLWAAAKAAQNTMLNGTPQFSDKFDQGLWQDVRAAFAPCLNLCPIKKDRP
jgi:hypothetical protein